MASVTLKNIRKVYPPIAALKKKKNKGNSEVNLEETEDGVVAVQDFSMEIKDREFVVLVGPSGCGKSTTLRMIAGLEDITSGELYIEDELVNEKEPKDRDIAMVFQNYALYPHMTVYDNMAFALKKRIKSKEEIRDKVYKASEILGITEYLNRKPKNLSGGQRQRVAIGRAIVRNPKVMLMDEPLSNLDAKLRNQMRSELIRLRKEINTTFVYVTHDQTEAMTLGDRIVVMKDGWVQQIGTPEEVFDEPENVFVATFIGTPQMNLFDGILKRRGDEYTVLIKNKELKLSDKANRILLNKNQEETDVSLGVRPDDITLSFDSGDFSSVISVVEHMGNVLHAHFDFCSKDVVALLDKKDDTIYKHLEIDKSIFFSFSPSSIYLFDRKSGKNIAK